MKRTKFILPIASALVMSSTGFAMASQGEARSGNAEPVPKKGSEYHAACNESVNMKSAALPAEAPWISLALQNIERIGLSKDQVRKLESLRTEFHQQATRETQTIATAEQELERLLSSEPADITRVRTQTEKIGALSASLRLSRIETLLKGKLLLSPEQRTNLQALIARSASEAHNAMMERVHGKKAPAEKAM